MVDFETHPVRGRFNAGFFRLMDGYIDWNLRAQKARVYQGLPATVVELGSGVGANLRYLEPGTKLIAVEPNVSMHRPLHAAAAKRGVQLELRNVVGEDIDLPDGSVDAVISSLVLCTVSDPERVVAEVRRILRPGGRYCFVEHVAAPSGTRTRRAQRVVRRPWSWVFEGCSCERDLAAMIGAAGFGSTKLDRYRIHTPLVPFNTQIAGIATA